MTREYRVQEDVPPGDGELVSLSAQEAVCVGGGIRIEDISREHSSRVVYFSAACILHFVDAPKRGTHHPGGGMTRKQLES